MRAFRRGDAALPTSRSATIASSIAVSPAVFSAVIQARFTVVFPSDLSSRSMGKKP